MGAQGLEHASGIRAPVRCNTEVLSLRDSEDGRSMEVATARRDIRAKNVVVATGPFHAPKIPVLSRELPSDLFQIHSRDYRNPSQLPRGATLVVGSGASGTQIAEELHRSGRRVILAVGRCHKTPVGIEDATSIGGSTSFAVAIVLPRPSANTGGLSSEGFEG